MATSNNNSESSSKKIPPERSLPSLGSDEESFVVLWKDTDNKSIDTINIESVGSCSSLDEKTKSLINKELLETEQASLSNKEKKDKLSEDKPSSSNEEKEVKHCRTEQFIGLPTMPLPDGEIETDGVISITAFPSDLTSDQIQKKISDLIEENTRLKYIITQNNSTMKSQYEKIVAWQEDVGKVHEAHRKKIVEAKEFIEKLKMDKYKLGRELEQMKEERDSHIQEKISHSTDADIKVKVEQAMKNLIAENIDLRNRVEEREKEITDLQTDLHITKNELEEAKLELIKMKSRYEDELKSLNLIIHTLKSQDYSLASSENVANVQNQSARFTQTQDRAATSTHMEREEKSQTLLDEIHAQRAQLELYRVDFEAERKAKETIQVEKEKLLKDVNKLETHIHKLQQKMNEIRENYVIIPKSQAPEPEECCLQ